MSKPMTFRIDPVHSALLDKMVEKLTEKGISTNKTDVIQKALYAFATNNVLEKEEVDEIIEKHYTGFQKD